jgi:hypothetical protein
MKWLSAVSNEEILPQHTYYTSAVLVVDEIFFVLGLALLNINIKSALINKELNANFTYLFI